MGHHITGIVARREVLKSLEGPFAGQPCYALAAGWAFMPLDDANLDEIIGSSDAIPVGEFCFLDEPLIDLLCLASRGGELAYVETDYFGGVGAQGAVGFRGGMMVSAPAWGERNVINGALSELGVKPETGKLDAFEAVGLDLYRSNERMREEGTPI